MANAAHNQQNRLLETSRPFLRWLAQTWREGGKLFRVLLVCWFLGMTAVPIIGWTLGPAAQINAVVTATILQTVLGIVTLRLTWGTVRAVAAALLIGTVTWGAEALGTATGFPFGAYNYTDVLQPQVAHVPLLIPIAWMMVLPSAWAIGQLVRERIRVKPPLDLLILALVAAAALTAWDLGLDPQMVGWNLWQWANEGAYFGIPLSNYAGWFGTAFVGTLLVWLLVAPKPDKLAADQLLLVYGLTWFFMSFGLVLFWGLAGPGLVLFAVMGAFLLLAIWLRHP